MSPRPAPTSPLDGKHTPSATEPSRFDTPAGELAMREWFEPGTRTAYCAVCGQSFTQHKLSERFLEMARSKPAFPIGAAHAIDRVIPNGWVPLFCPPCERRALNGQDWPAVLVSARIDQRYLEDERAALQEAL